MSFEFQPGSFTDREKPPSPPQTTSEQPAKERPMSEGDLGALREADKLLVKLHRSAERLRENRHPDNLTMLTDAGREFGEQVDVCIADLQRRGLDKKATELQEAKLLGLYG